MMKNMKTLSVFVSAAFFLLAAVLFSEDAVWSGKDLWIDEDPMQILLKDPVGSELAAYHEAANEVRENPSPIARLAHYQEWKERFQKIITENPESEFVGYAKEQLLGLYNSLGEFDKSQVLLQDLITTSKRPEDKIHWQNELGEVSRARYWTSQDRSDLAKAQEAFEQANELYRSLPPERQEGHLSGQQIVNLCTAAMAAKEANDHEKSATLFRSARELFQSSAENAKHAVSTGYDLEIITEQEMIEWIRVKKEADALKCLEILSKLPSFRWCPSYYALNYAALWYENDSKGFQNFVSKWLDNNVSDERTPILMANLGFSYFDDGLYEQALPIYETLRDKHRGDFQKLEPKAFEKGNGGCYERILFDLSKIYVQRKDIGKAESAKTELTTLLPESSRAKLLSDSHSSQDLSDLPQPQRERYLGLRITSVIISIILICWGLYRLWTREG